MNKLFQTSFFELYFEPSKFLFKMIWLENTQYMKEEEFKRDMLRYVSFFDLNAKGILHDMRENKFVIQTSLQDWVGENVNLKSSRIRIM